MRCGIYLQAKPGANRPSSFCDWPVCSFNRPIGLSAEKQCDRVWHKVICDSAGIKRKSRRRQRMIQRRYHQREVCYLWHPWYGHCAPIREPLNNKGKASIPIKY
ncbi:MAG: hypothetical protein DMG05_10175 [Acidobacteria bacterium]|nr:MAG: hypothetical protein DMG05_10175 [Acidobacteriota bacterium]